VEDERPTGLGVNAVEHQHVEMHIQVQAAPEALDHRECARPPVRDPASARLPSIETDHGAREHGEYRPAQSVVPGQQVA
jgi:hypothetical protein